MHFNHEKNESDQFEVADGSELIPDITNTLKIDSKIVPEVHHPCMCELF